MTDKRNKELHALTEECLYSALFKLLQSKAFEEIKITELCKVAGVSRMAFYRHYKNKIDIIHQHFINLYKEKTVIRVTKGYTTIHEANDLMIREIYDNKDDFSMLIQYGKAELFIDLVYDFIRSFLKSFQYDTDFQDDVKESVSSYVTGGVTHLIIHWIKSGYKLSPKRMIQLADTLHFIDDVHEKHYYKGT